jgi:hypothetical protein
VSPSSREAEWEYACRAGLPTYSGSGRFTETSGSWRRAFVWADASADPRGRMSRFGQALRGEWPLLVPPSWASNPSAILGRLQRARVPKEVDDGIVHCASRCDTSFPMSCGPSAWRVQAPVSILEVLRSAPRMIDQKPYPRLNSPGC